MKLTKKDKMTPLEKEIANVCSTLYHTAPDSDQYRAISENLERLCRAQSQVQKRTIDPNTLVTAASSLLGILLILGYEHNHVITSKALGFVLRGRA